MMPLLRWMIGAVIVAVVMAIVTGLIVLRGTRLDVAGPNTVQQGEQMMAVELGTSSELGPSSPIDDTL